jgi:Tol biopolymer transport system component
MLNVQSLAAQSNPTPQATRGTRVQLPSLSIPTGYSGKLVYSRLGAAYVLELATGNHYRYDGASLMVFPDWHPDGNAFVCGEGTIYRVDTNTGIITQITSQSGGRRPAYSPDGTQIIYGGYGSTAVAIFDTRTGQTIELSRPLMPIMDADWTANGDRIVFNSGGLIFNVEGIQILTVDAAAITSGNYAPTQLTFGDVNSRNLVPKWSPDGQQIVFESRRDGCSAIYVMSADGSDQRALTNNSDGDFEPTWSPDGQYIAFRRIANNISNIFIMRADGSDDTQITTEGGFEPDWWMPPASVNTEPTSEPTQATP